MAQSFSDLSAKFLKLLEQLNGAAKVSEQATLTDKLQQTFDEMKNFPMNHQNDVKTLKNLEDELNKRKAAHGSCD